MAITGNIDLGKWLSTMYQDYTAGRAQKETMFGKGVGALEGYADIFRPGGEYGAGVEAMIGRGEKKAVAGGMQSLVSAGLANTTMPMHLQQTYQEEIGMPTRMRAEDVRMERLGGALGSLGQMYAGYDPGGPSAGDIAHMATGGFGMQQTGRIADMNAQVAAWGQDPYPSGRFEDQFGGGAGGGGGGGGGGGFSNPYGGGGVSGGGGGAGGGTAPAKSKHRPERDIDYQGVFMGGQRIEPGTEDIWKPMISRQAATEWGIDPASRGYTYDANRAAWIAPMGGGGAEDIFAPSTPTGDPFADYAARVSGISAYL